MFSYSFFNQSSASWKTRKAKLFWMLKMMHTAMLTPTRILFLWVNQKKIGERWAPLSPWWWMYTRIMIFTWGFTDAWARLPMRAGLAWDFGLRDWFLISPSDAEFYVYLFIYSVFSVCLSVSTFCFSFFSLSLSRLWLYYSLAVMSFAPRM